MIFLRFLENFGNQNASQNRFLEKFFAVLFGHLHFGAIVWRFLCYLLRANLQNSCAHAMFCWSWQFLAWSQNVSKVDPKTNGFWNRKSRKNNLKRLQKHDLFSTWLFHQIWTDFARSWEGLGEVLGNILASKKNPKRAKWYFSMRMWFSKAFGKVWGTSWKVWERFWEGFGKVWELFGCFRDPQALF